MLSPPARLLDRLESAIGTTREFRLPLPRDRFDEAFSEWSQAHPDIEAPRIIISETDPNLATVCWTVSHARSFRSIAHCLLALGFAFLASRH